MALSSSSIHRPTSGRARSNSNSFAASPPPWPRTFSPPIACAGSCWPTARGWRPAGCARSRRGWITWRGCNRWLPEAGCPHPAKLRPRGVWAPRLHKSNVTSSPSRPTGRAGSLPMSKATKSRQLNSDELLRLKWLLGGAMSLVALWTVFFLDIEALSLVAIASAIVLAAGMWPQLPGRLPPILWKFAMPGIIVAEALDLYFSPDTLPVFIRLAILLVLYRAVGYRRKREDLQ